MSPRRLLNESQVPLQYKNNYCIRDHEKHKQKPNILSNTWNVCKMKWETSVHACTKRVFTAWNKMAILYWMSKHLRLNTYAWKLEEYFEQKCFEQKTTKKSYVTHSKNVVKSLLTPMQLKPLVERFLLHLQSFAPTNRRHSQTKRLGHRRAW